MISNNITQRALAFTDYLESSISKYEYKTKIFVTKESTWTPYYAIFLAVPEYENNGFIHKQLSNDLNTLFSDCKVRFNKNLNEIEIEHPKSAAYFDKHRKILEEIGMEYSGWTAFLTND